MNPSLYECNLCEYSTMLLSNYKKHTTTQKHLWNYHNIKTSKEEEEIICNCGKRFKTRSGAWKHQKSCAKSYENACAKSQSLDASIILSIVKQNQEFKDFMVEHCTKQAEQQQELQSQLIELAKTGINVTNNITTNNTNNVCNTNFNLTIFLNETCKDALNMQDFVETLPITMADLEETGKIGYTNGISRLFVNGLKILDVNKRPIHCSDLKREVLYIKDCDVWEKDGEEQKLIKQAIRMVESKNIKLIPQWASNRPGVFKSDHRDNTQYLNIICQSTGGTNNEEEENVRKIIKNILRESRIAK